MKDSSNKLALLGRLHCLLGFFGTIILTHIFYLLYGLSGNNPSLILPTILTISYSICLFFSGICMARRKGYSFSLIVALIGLIFAIPTFGLMAILVFPTIYILNQDSVKILYEFK